MKLLPGKSIYPGRKEIYRIERDGSYAYDVLAQRGESIAGKPQLETVFKDGSLVYDPPDLGSIRERTRRELEKLPELCRQVREPDTYEVRISEGLETTARSTERAIRNRER